MKFILNGDKLTVENEESSNSGSVQYYEVDVEHDDSWDDLTIEAVIVPKEGGTLIFDDAESIAEIDNKIYIDRELSGSYAIGFKGYTIENEVKVYQISTNLQGVYFEVGAGQIITTNSIPKPTEWEIYVAQIEAIANRASQSADDAQTSAENAETSAENAQTSAETATEQAETATEKASNASASATTATEQAGIATTKAGEASTSATNAKTSEDNAKASEQSASSSASSASASAESAGASAGSAATSASLASSSEGVASQKAEEASASANSASASASSAEQSKNTAQELVNGFTSTVQTATSNFNENATEKTNAFDTNATEKTNSFNDNATSKTTTFDENATSKTTDFNDNASDKTTEFNEVVDTAKDDIEEIAPMLQDKIAKIPSMMKDKTITGTSIHTTDSALWYGKLNFEGFSRQNTRSGKNVMPMSSYDTTEQRQKTFNLNLPAGTYTISYDLVSFELGTNNSFGLYMGLYNDEALDVDVTIGMVNSNAETGRKSATFTTNSAITINSRTSNIRIGNTQYSNGGRVNITNIQIEAGSTATEYEEYGVSPSIDYPSEDRNLEAVNILNPEDLLQGNFSPSTGGNNEVSEVSNIRVCTKLIDISKIKDSIIYVGPYSELISFYADDLSYISYTNGNKSSIPDNAKYCRLRFYNSGNELLVSTMKNMEIALNEGTVPKPYAPYDSLRFKQIGRNKFDKSKNPNYTNQSTATELPTGIRVVNANNGTYHFISYLLGTAKDLSGKTIRVASNVKKYVDDGLIRIMTSKSDFSDRTTLVSSGNTSGNTIISTTIENIDEDLYILLTLNSNTSTAGEVYTDYTDLIVTIDNEDMTFEPYKEHNIDFLCNGQKFYAGSKPIDNRIRHIRTQVILDGTETVTKGTGAGALYNYYLVNKTLSKVPKYSTDLRDSLLCSHFKAMVNATAQYIDNGIALSSNLNRFVIACDEITTAEDFQARLAQEYANGTPVTIEYELAEPETVPYTQAQQDAYDELQNLETYQYVNNIDLIANEETNMTLDYKKDIQMQIAEETSKLTQAIVALGGVVE